MSNLSQRPGTLSEVSRRVLAGQQAFDPAVREFLDEFYSHPSRRKAALRREPELIEDVKDAYLAAVAEYLASNYGIEMPPWVDRHGRPLKRAFFAGGLESLKAILTVESPAAFRRRCCSSERTNWTGRAKRLSRVRIVPNRLSAGSRRDNAATPGPDTITRLPHHMHSR
jgi:hypothetical protein